MPGAIGWAPALLPSRGGVIARPRFNLGTLIPRTCAPRLGDRGSQRSRGSQLASHRPNSGPPASLTTCKVRVLPPCQFFGHTGSRVVSSASCPVVEVGDL